MVYKRLVFFAEGVPALVDADVCRQVEGVAQVRRGEDVGAGSVGEGLAGREQQCGGRVLFGEDEVVDDEQDGGPAVSVEFEEQVHDFVLVCDVEVGERFVEKKQGRLLSHGSSNHRALQFSTAEL